MKKKFVIFLSSILLAISSFIVPIFGGGKTSAKAVTTSDTTSYVSVDEIWDNANKVIKTSNLSLLFDYISGTNRTQYSQIKSLAANKLSAKDMRANSLTNSAGTVVKEANKDIIVTVGGLKWQVTYLSTDKNGNPILTLWLATSSVRDSFASYSARRSNVNPSQITYPSNMYGTSHVRSVVLNNGGVKAKSENEIIIVEKSSSNTFADFTMSLDGEYNDLTDFITTPEYVEWQEFQTKKQYGITDFSTANNLSNEAWSRDLPDTGFAGSQYNYAHKNYSDYWKNDFIWLPSLTEVGGRNENKGVWELSTKQKAHDKETLLRTCDESNFAVDAVLHIKTSGNAIYDPWSNDGEQAIRPAFHLNLARVMESLEKNAPEDNSVLYLDPVYGNDNENGKTILSAIKDIKFAEKIVEENGKVVLLNTLTILEDTVLGANKTYTLQRYYKSSTDVFTGKMIVAGNYVSSGSADNVDVKLVLKTMIDSNKQGSQFQCGDVITVNGNSSLVIEEKGGIKNHYGAENNTATRAIVLNQTSTFTMNGGSIIGINSYGDGGIIRCDSTGDITFNGGLIQDGYVNLGGVLIYSSKTGNIIINGGTFKDLRAANYSAIISADYKDLIINDVEFDSNYQAEGGSSPTNGLFRTKNITINGGTFKNNYINPSDDKETNSSGMFYPITSLTINGGYFENNKNERSGAIIRLTNGATATIKNATFKGNEAYLGGIAYIDSANITIENCVFEGNKATNKVKISSNDTYGGGVLYATGTSVVNILDCSFKNNTAVKHGGVFVTTSDVVFNCWDSYFEGNSATAQSNNDKDRGGVGSHDAVWSKKVNYYNCDFISNTTSHSGGALSNAHVYDSLFKGNGAHYGGAVYVVYAYNCDFVNNNSTRHGGAGFACYGLTGCYFENNTTDGNGGAVCVVQDAIDCEFVDNKATGFGGAISSDCSWFKYINIDDCSFTGNYTDKNGGAIYLDNSSPETGFTGASLTNCYIEGNIAKVAGAGVSIHFYNAGLILGKANTPNYMFVDNNFIGSNFDSPGPVESNLYIYKDEEAAFKGLTLFSNLEEDSVIDLDSNAILTNELVAEITGENVYVNDSTIEAFTYKGTNYEFYSKTISSGNVKTGVGIYIKPVNGSGLVYTASDNYAEYDGLAHTINVNVINPTSNYGVVYSTDENGTYSTTPITVKEPGETATVWFKIVSDAYGESSPESRVVTISKLDIFVKTELVAKTWIGETFTKDVNIPVAVSGEIVDIYGNAIACDFLPTATKQIAKGDHNHDITVTIRPKNTQKYKTLEGQEVIIKISYDELYFKDNNFSVDYEQTAKYKVSNTTATIAEMVEFLENDARVYFVSTYIVSNSLTIETDKNIEFTRYYVNDSSTLNFKKAIFSVNSGKTLTIGSLLMAGSVKISNLSFDAKVEEALIINKGNLNIYGDVTITNSWNNSGSTFGGGICNEGTLFADGATFFYLRTQESGGAIYNTGTATLKNCFVRNCYAKEKGSGIFSSGTLTIENCNIISNQGWVETDNDANAPKGMGIFVTGSASKTTIIASSILNNTCSNYNRSTRYGGGLYIADGAHVDVRDSEFLKNSAIRGGAVYVDTDSSIRLVNTKVNENLLQNAGDPYGAAFFVEVGGVVDFISGSISANNMHKADKGARSIIYVKGTFNFGELGSLNAVMTANQHQHYADVTALLMRVVDGGVFNMYGGKIFMNYACASTIYINKNAVANFYSGEFYNNNYSGTNAVINVYGELFININNFYINNSIGTGVFSQTEARIHLVGDISKANSIFTLNYISIADNGVTISKGMIVDLIATEQEQPTEEEWNAFVSKITWYNNSNTKVTYGTDVVDGFNVENNRYYVRVNNTITVKTVYLNTSTGNDSNDGTTKAKAVGSLEYALTLNPTTIYLLSTIDCAGTKVINGNNVILKRHVDFTDIMFRVVSMDGKLTINNLIIDGNADKDGSVNQFKDYLISQPVITNNGGLTLTLNNVTIRNNATKTSGAGIYIKVATGDSDYNIILNNTNIVNNTVVMDSSVSNSTKIIGVGLSIDNTVATIDKINVNLNVNNCDISRNTMASTTGGQTSNYFPYGAHGGMGIGIYSDSHNTDLTKTFNVNIKNTNFVSNKVEGVNVYFGSAIMFAGYDSKAGTKGNEVNFNIDNCYFTDNGAQASNVWTNAITSVITIQSLYNAKVNFKVKDTNFANNTSYSAIWVRSDVDNSSVEMLRCKVSNDLPNYPTDYQVCYYLKGTNSNVLVKNCDISGTKSPTKSGLYFGSNAPLTVDTYYNVVVEDCMLYNLNVAVNNLYANLTVKNTYMYNLAGNGINLSSKELKLKLTNCKIYNSASWGIQLTIGCEVVAENTEIFNLGSAVNISNNDNGYKLKVSGLKIYNMTNYGIMTNNDYNIGDITISNCQITRTGNYGIYIQLGSSTLNNAHNYTNIINIENCLITNCVTGLCVNSADNYNASTPTPTTHTINLKNTKITKNTNYGLYGVYGSSSNPYVVTQFNFDSNCEISGNTFGIYENKTTTSKTHVYSGSPKIVDNAVAGIWFGSDYNKDYRLDLNLTNAIFDNTVDIYYPKIYIQGTNIDVKKVLCTIEADKSGIVLTGTTTLKNKLTITSYATSIVANLKLIGADSGYTTNPTELDGLLAKLSFAGWDLKVDGTNIVLSTKTEVGEQANVYYLDCENKTGKAKDSPWNLGLLDVNDGLNKDAPVLTFNILWTKCIDHSKKSIVYLYSRCEIKVAGTYDFANVTFIPYVNPDTNQNNIFSSSDRMLFLNQNVTIKNLTIDGKDFVRNDLVEYLIYASSSSYEMTFENLTIKNFENNAGSYRFVYLASLKNLTIKNSTFSNLKQRSNTIYDQPLCISSCALNIENCNFYNVYYGIYVNTQTKNVTIKNSNFDRCYYGINMSLTGDQKTIIENCDFINCYYGVKLDNPYSTEINNCDFDANFNAIQLNTIRSDKTSKILNCVINNSFEHNIHLIGNNSDNQPVTIENCEIYNGKNYGVYINNIKKLNIKNSDILNCKYGVYGNSECNLNLVGYIEGNEYGVYSRNLVLNSGIIQNNKVGVYNAGAFTINGGVIKNNTETAIDSSSNTKAKLNIKGGIIDSTNGTKQVMLSSGEIVSYSIYTTGTINISGNPIVTAPILTTTFDKSRVVEFTPIPAGTVLFDVVNDSVYPWYEDGEGNLRVDMKGIHGKTSTITFTAKYDIVMTFNVRITSEGENWDYYTIVLNGSQIDRDGGPTEKNKTHTIELEAGDILKLAYRKDGGTEKGWDTPLFQGINLNGTADDFTAVNNLKTNNSIDSADKPYYVKPTTTTYTFVKSNDGALVNNNGTGINTGTTATYSIVATKNFNLSFDYFVHSHANAYLQVKINGTEDKKVNGSTTGVAGSYTKNVVAGDNIDIIFYKPSNGGANSAIITNFEYVTPMLTPTVIIGDLGTKAIVNFVVPSNAVVGDAIASYNGTLTDAKLTETIKYIKVNGHSVSKNISGGRYGITLGAASATAVNDVRDISNYIFFDPNNAALDDTNDGRTPQTPVRTWDRVLEIAQETGCDKVFVMSVWQITENTTIEGNGLTLYRYYLSSAAQYNTGIVIQVKTGISLTVNNLSFNGNYKVNGVEAIKATNKLIYVEANASLKINNSTIENCATNYNSGGVVIYNLGDTILNNVIVKDNYALSHAAAYISSGAAIYSQGDLEINNSIFTNNINYMASRYSSNAGGGAINMYGKSAEINLKITNSYFEKNQHYYSHSAGDGNTGFGGAIFARTKVNITIDNCDFVSNRSQFGGGAVCLYDCKTIDIRKSNFDNNYNASGNTNYYGSAIDISNATSVEVDNCYFYRNGVSGVSRGSLSIRGVYDVNLTNTEFNYNRGGAYAAAFFISESSTSKEANITLDNVYVHNNYQTNSGGDGAIAYLSSSKPGNVTIKNSIFENNSNDRRYYYKSLFYFTAGNLVLENVDFTNNVNRYNWDGSYSMLRIIAANGGDVTLKNININNNFAYDGYMIRIDNTSSSATADIDIYIENFVAKNNFAGAIFCVTTTTLGNNNKCTLKNVTLDNNTKIGDNNYNGVAMTINRMIVDVENLTITNQHYLEGYPYSCFSMYYCSGELKNVLLKDNVQYYSTLRVVGTLGSGQSIKFKNLRVIDNRARAYNSHGSNDGRYSSAGVLIGNMDQCIIENSEISGNTILKGFGSGITSYNSGVVLKDTIVRNNTFLPDKKGETQSLVLPDRVIVKDSGFEPYNLPLNGEIPELRDLYGGAGVGVYGGTLEVVGGEIYENVSNGLGGGILAYAPLKVNGAKIYDNKALNGAGILATMDTYIENAEIYNNDASSKGGAVWFTSGLNINNSNIYGNTAGSAGAGLYSDSEISSLIIDSSSINENVTQGQGAGVDFRNPTGEFKVINSKFIGNRANAQGTAIYSKTEPNISYTEFSGNYIEGSSLIHFGAVYATVLDNVVISGNYCKGDYATLFSFDNSSISLPRFDISNSKIYGNTSDKLALIIIDKNIYFSINDSEVYGNTNADSAGKGGLINVESGVLKLENGTLKNNHAVYGGSVYFSSGSNGLFINSVVTGHTNTTGTNYCVNGAIYIENGAEVKFIGGSITTNDVAKSNGVIYNAGSLNFNGTEIFKNVTKNGVIYNDLTGLLSLENIDINTNIAYKGGAIYNKGTANFVSGEICGNKVVDESATIFGQGGAVYNAEGGIFTMTNGHIYFNSASHSGGAVFNQGDFIINNGEIFGNNMKVYGGAIYNGDKGKLVINGGQIYENGPISGSTNVAGLAVANFGEMYMYDGEIINNYIDKNSSSFASSKGGAIYSGAQSYTSILGGYINNNVTQNGSGIYADNHSVVDVKNITIDNTSKNANTTTYGRAVYAYNAKVNLVNVAIKCGNVMGNSNDNVGSVASINSTLTISGCEFMYNKDNVGVVSCNGGSLVIEDTLFKNNKTEFAATSSGILYLENLQKLSITYSDFVNNSTITNGGAIALVLNQEFNGIIENCLFENNNAGNSGGAIYITSTATTNSDSMLTIKNSTFIGNYAESSGGAIALTKGNGIEVIIEDSIFGGVKDKNTNGVIDNDEYLSNVSGGDGGAIYYGESESAMSLTLKGNNEITYNKATGFGGGIFYDYAYASNTESDYYGLKIESASMPIITNNTHGSNVTSNLYILNTADRKILTTGLKKGSLVGITLVSTNSEVIGVDTAVVYGRDAKAPITSNDRVAFVYDDTKFLFKLDSTSNALVLVANETKFMKAVANDVIHAVDGHFKSVTAEDIQVIGVTDYTVTFASAQDGNYTAEGPKYTLKGVYEVWYKVVDNTGKNDPIIGSVKLKLTGKILLLENAPTAYINKGEKLEQATFKGGLVLSDGSAVSGSWAFENGTITPTNSTQKYKVVFNPSNEYIYENEISTYVTINISYNRVFYVEDGFYVDKEGTKPTGITLLSEMVSCMKELGSIYFVTTYEVGSSGVLSEDVYTDKKIYFGVTPRLGANNMIKLPSSVKLTLGGGSGEIIIDGRMGYSVSDIEVPLFENNGILTLKSNVRIEYFTNTKGKAAVVENNGMLYLNGCTIYNCRSYNNDVECFGGAIGNSGSVYVNGGDYRYNRAHGSRNLNGLGGFIYNDGGNVVINSGNFARNMAYNGGFIYSNGGNITINGGEIYGCHAYHDGGAIYLTSNAQLDINGGNIMLNRAANQGAGVFVDNSVVYLNGGVVKYNTVTSSVGFDDPYTVENNANENNANWVIGVLSVLVIAAIFVVITMLLKPKNKKFKIKIRK